jgi:hypothetical protein
MNFEEELFKAIDELNHAESDGYIKTNLSKKDFYSEKEYLHLISVIDRYCLLKQGVKEAIDKVFNIDDYEDRVHNELIKKELGLEDE